MNKPVLWIINHYAIPPREAGGTRHFDFAFELSEKWNYDIYIIASKFNHLSKKYTVKEKGTVKEKINGVNFIWIDTIDYKKNNWRRVLNLIQFTYKLLFFRRKVKIKKPDIIIGSTVHPFAALAGGLLSKIHKSEFIFEIRDLWPQTFIDMELWSKSSVKSKLFRLIEKKTVKKAKKIIVLSPLTIPYLNKNYDHSSISFLYLPNSVVINNFANTKYKKSANEKLKVMYLGGIEKVHGLESLFEAAEKLEDDYKNKLEIHIVGDGKKREEYIKLTKNSSIVKWHSSVPKIEVPEKLKNADVLYLSTGKVLYGSENKLAEYLATGRSLLVSTEGEHNNPVNEIKCGIAVNPNDVNDLVKALIKFCNLDSDVLENYAFNAQKLAEKKYSIEQNSKYLADFINK